jgi:hypothetical protein
MLLTPKVCASWEIVPFDAFLFVMFALMAFPDASGRARTRASKLVAGAGVSGSSPLVGSSLC